MTTFRGVLHAHSTLSDGKLWPEQVRERALAEGLDFVILCEHAKHIFARDPDAALAECARLSDDSFLLMLGIEHEYEGRHVLLIGPPELLRESQGDMAGARPGEVRDRGGLTIWAHPACTFRCSLRPGMAADYDGWEVWNRGFDGRVPNLRVLAELRRQRGGGRQLFASAGADFHRPEHPLEPILEVELPKLSSDALIASLRDGRFVGRGEKPRSLTLKPDGDLGPVSLGDRLYAAAKHRLTRAYSSGAWTKYLILRRLRGR